MAFNLVIVQRPSDQFDQKWPLFLTYSGADKLENTEGAFCLSDTAWLFDTRKALSAFSQLVHQATKGGIPVFVFQLPLEKPLSCAVAFPRSDKLEKFLSS